MFRGGPLLLVILDRSRRLVILIVFMFVLILLQRVASVLSRCGSCDRGVIVILSIVCRIGLEVDKLQISKKCFMTAVYCTTVEF